MRRLVTTALELIGLGLVAVAAYSVSISLGLLVTGAVLIVVAQGLEREDRKE